MVKGKHESPHVVSPESVLTRPLLDPTLELRRLVLGRAEEDAETMDTDPDGPEESFLDSNVYFPGSLEFIKTLPRPKPSIKVDPLHLRTRRTRPITLVLDLDETLVHSQGEFLSQADDVLEVSVGSEMCRVFVSHRPKLRKFLRKVSQVFEVVLFTAGIKDYADGILRKIDPGRRWLRHRYYRDSCLEVNGVYVKDLSALGRDLSKVVIVDNSLHAFAYHLDNAVLIKSWFRDREDRALDHLWRFLKGAIDGVQDVRPVLRRSFGLGNLCSKH